MAINWLDVCSSIVYVFVSMCLWLRMICYVYAFLYLFTTLIKSKINELTQYNATNIHHRLDYCLHLTTFYTTDSYIISRLNTDN